MDLAFTPEEITFRDEVRAFIRDNLPTDIRDRMRLGHSPRKEDQVRWQRILNKKGWAAYSWPTEYGGPGWSAIQRQARKIPGTTNRQDWRRGPGSAISAPRCRTGSTPDRSSWC